MWFRWRRPRPAADLVPPAGVVLHLRGRAIPCAVLRDEDLDRRGETAWLAVPDDPVTVYPGDDVTVTATVLPDGAVLILGVAGYDLALPPGRGTG